MSWTIGQRPITVAVLAMGGEGGGDDGDTGGLGQATPDGCVHEMSSFSG